MSKAIKTPISFGFSLHTIVAALLQAQAVTPWLGKSEYKVGNSEQILVMKYMDKIASDIDAIPEMKSMAHSDVLAIQNFLETREPTKSEIDIKDVEFSVGALFDLVLKWSTEGKVQNLVFRSSPGTCVAGPIVKAARMKDAIGKKGLVFCVNAKHGLKAYFSRATQDQIEDLGKVNAQINLFSHTLELAKLFSSEKVDLMKVDLIFPFIDIAHDESTPCTWLKGMDLDGDETTNHPGYTIIDANTKNSLKMDNKGAVIKSEADIRYRTKGISRPNEVIALDSPFLFWVERQGCSLPIFSAYCALDATVGA